MADRDLILDTPRALFRNSRVGLLLPFATLALGLGPLLGCVEKPPEPAPAPKIVALPRPPRVVRALPLRRPEPPQEMEAPSSSDRGLIRFDEIDAVCGDLGSRRSFLCLANRGFERVPEGVRLVIRQEEAAFSMRVAYHDFEPSGGLMDQGQGEIRRERANLNGVHIDIIGRDRNSLEFGPPRDRTLLRGLYSNTMHWPSNEGPSAGLNVAIGSACPQEEGQFYIRRIVYSGKTVVGFEADFETTCNQAIGRISVGSAGESSAIKVEKHDGRMVISDP